MEGKWRNNPKIRENFGFFVFGLFLFLEFVVLKRTVFYFGGGKCCNNPKIGGACAI